KRRPRVVAAAEAAALGAYMASVSQAAAIFRSTRPMPAFGGKADIQRTQSMPAFRAYQTSTLRLDADAAFRWADIRPRIAELAADRGSLVASPQAAFRL